MDANGSIPTDPKTWADVIHELTAMNTTLQVMLFAAFVLWIIAWRGFAWWDKRQQAARQEALEAAKAERSERFNENINRMCILLEQHTSEEENNSTTMNRALVSLSSTVGGLGRELRDLRNRLSNVMSRRDTLSAIEEKLTGGVRADLCDIFEQSLRKNDYANRAEFIRRRVKTACGEVLAEAEQKLIAEYNLAFAPAAFFQLRQGEDGGRRHVLCDVLWEAIEPLYRTEVAPDRRVEEMRVVVENAISDLVSKGREEVTNIYKDEREGISRASSL